MLHCQILLLLQLFYGCLDFVRDNPGELVPEESFTHYSCRSHQSSVICFLHLLRSMASSMLNIHACQSFCTISPTFLWSTSWPGTLHFILHTFLHRVVVFFFCRTGPYHHNLFCCSTEIISSNPSLSLNSLLNTTHPSDHSHLCPLKSHLIFFSYRPDLTSMQHTALHTAAVQSAFHYE